MFGDIHCGYDCREYTDFSQDVDLVADSPSGEDKARSIEVLTAGGGVLMIETAVGQQRTLSGNLLVGRGLVCGIKKILAGTTVGRVLVIW